ncbi:MAG: acyl dehydratase, partial [Deltaproteobacteria bacterium]|nr:acyl dehydratase [Deltaproteobacteria bacterium]
MKIPYPPFKELSPSMPAKIDQAKYPQYGRVLEDFNEGEVFCHPRGITITRAFGVEFVTTFMETNPLNFNREYAIAHGYKYQFISPLKVKNITLS